MSKSNIFWMTTIAVVTALLTGAAQAATTVSNVAVAQRPGSKLVDISYDVASSQTNRVSVSVVVSNATGQLSASHFSGHVGAGVPTGTGRMIVWDGGADQGGQNLSGLRVLLSVSDSDDTPEVPSGMVAIPEGSFMMGSSVSLPIHPVELSAFHMDKTEVTKSMWDSVATWASSHGYVIGNAVGKATNHPAHSMQWHSAVKWCNARSEQAGLKPCYTNANGTVFKTGTFSGGCDWSANGFRLPTEAEWEYAARGTGEGNRFSWLDSNEIQHTRANYWSDAATSYDTSITRGYHPNYATGNMPYTSPAGSFAPNAYGLFDMVGNVFEWVWDWKTVHYATTPVLNPRGAATGSARVARGGSWGGQYPSCAWICDISYRGSSSPNGYTDYLGFRCVKNAAAAEEAQFRAVSAPFDADFRVYTFTVSSVCGTPTPPVGTTYLAWHATITGAVPSVVSANGTNWTCTGWTGTGITPASGSTTNTGTLLLTNVAATLTWQWAVTAFKPTLTAQPQSLTKTYAATTVFSVGATSLPAATYQWRRNGVNLSNNSRISGAQSRTLTINTIQLSDAGQFSVVVANAMGSVTSQVAVLTVNKAVLTVAANPASRPYNTANPALSATITGFVNGENASVVSGAPFLSTSATTGSNAGTYPIYVSQGSLSAANYSFSLVAGTLTVTRASQTVFFDCLPPQVTTGEADLPLDANASSGLPVSYSSENQAVATIDNDSVMICGAGYTTIAAEQPGNENYLPAQTSHLLVVVELTGFEKWADDNGLAVGPLGDLFAQDHDSDGIPNGFEYAFGANLVPDAQVLVIRMVNGRPVVDVPQQDAATTDFVDVRVEGCTDLLCGPDGWTLAVRPASDTTGKPSARAWYEPDGEAPSKAFFRLNVELK